MAIKIVAIGEVMLELSQGGPEIYHLGYAGDSFNSALYMARLGLSVRYASALGKDRFSDHILDTMRDEGIDTSLVSRVDDRLPGLYLIENEQNGERRFHYWRDQAPIRDLFATREVEWRKAILDSDCVYLTGISLAVIGTEGRAALLQWLSDAYDAGVKVALDINYRARLWPDVATARAAIMMLLPFCTFLSVSSEDVDALWPRQPSIAADLAATGVEVVERRSTLEAVAHLPGRDPVTHRGERAVAIDATGAGDSFNAAYIAARLAGGTAASALDGGHRLAREVVRSRGAILPRETMTDMAITAAGAQHD